MRALTIAVAIALGGCAAQYMNASMYTRTDNRTVDAAQKQATLAQCKSEAATAAVQVIPGGPYGVVERARKEAAVVDACMTRNGYIQAPQ
jgi:hypothetical protein